MGEPAENPAPPKRRRRHWLIVALLIVVVSGIAWWEWPRGDERFVGKWEWRYADGQPTAVIRLRSNGSGINWGTDGSKRGSFPWAVEDGCFVTGYRSKMIRSLVNEVSLQTERLFGWTPFFLDGDQVQYRIDHIDDNAIKMVLLPLGETANEQIVLRRIPE